MSKINEKLGLKPAGKRAMMDLPDDRALRTRLTSARCPACDARGARLMPGKTLRFFCSWCAHSWEPTNV